MRFFGNAHKELQQLERSVALIRDQVYSELDEHREAINADTLELNLQASRLDDVEKKLEMISLKLEKLTTSLEHVTVDDSYTYTPLTVHEQQVFIALYTADAEQWMSLRDISLRAGVQLSMVPSLLESMVFKNIPLRRELCGDECKVLLDKSFKTHHAKNNVVFISDLAKFNAQTRQHVTLDRFSAL